MRRRSFMQSVAEGLGGLLGVNVHADDIVKRTDITSSQLNTIRADHAPITSDDLDKLFVDRGAQPFIDTFFIGGQAITLRR